MNRHRRQGKIAAANRFAKLAALRADLAKKSGLDESDLRVDAAAFAALAVDSGKVAILHGAQAAIEPWRALHDALLALFPPKPKPFVIQFVEGFICRVCKASADAEEAAAAAEAKAKTEAEAAKAKAALEADEQSTEAVTKTPGAIDPADAANSPATPVEPKPAPAARPAPLLRESVHEHFAAPLHRADEPWRGFVGGNERFGFGRFDNRD